MCASVEQLLNALRPLLYMLYMLRCGENIIKVLDHRDMPGPASLTTEGQQDPVTSDSSTQQTDFSQSNLTVGWVIKMAGHVQLVAGSTRFFGSLERQLWLHIAV